MIKPKPKFGLDEWRARKAARRKKQQQTNLIHAKIMHKARLDKQNNSVVIRKIKLPEKIYIGCSGWFYWLWRRENLP